MSDKWTTAQIPDQSGRVALVTGANSGLGLVTARELARAGARVVMACRNEEKGREAVRAVEVRAPGAEVELESLDLASLDSVRGLAERVRERHPAIDLLINNAGVMAPPRGETADGFELQLGTNHLGHFALTGLLLDTLEGREDARVVTLTSNAHKGGRIAFDNLARRAPLLPLERLLAVQARQPDVRARARSAAARGGIGASSRSPPTRAGPRRSFRAPDRPSWTPF